MEELIKEIIKRELGIDGLNYFIKDYIAKTQIVRLIDEMIGYTDILDVNGVGKISGLDELKQKIEEMG